MVTSATAVAINALQSQKATAAIYPSDIDSKFHRLLEVDQNSPEFNELWAAVDKYITLALAAKKNAVA